MPNVLSTAAGSRTLLLNPGSTINKTLLGLGGQTQPDRRKPTSQKAETLADAAEEPFITVFGQPQFVVMGRIILPASAEPPIGLLEHLTGGDLLYQPHGIEMGCLARRPLA